MRKKRQRRTIICKFILGIIAFCLLLLYDSTGKAMTTNLKVAFNCNLPPYQFIDENGKIVGMHIDILEAIASKKGLVIEYIPKNTNIECMVALNNGEVDIVLGTLMNKNSEYYAQFTDEISSSTLCMVASNEFAEDLKKGLINQYYISFEYGTINYSYLSGLRASQYFAKGNQIEIFHSQISGETDAIVAVKNSILYQLEKEKLWPDYTIIRNYIATIKYTMAVQKGDNELMRYLNDGIANLHSTSEYENLYRHWTVDEESKNISLIMRNVLIGSCAVTVFILFYTFIMSKMKMVLKKEVSDKTKEIQDANIELERRITQIQIESQLKNLIIEHSPIAMILFNEEYKITLANSYANILVNNDNLIGEDILTLNIVGELLKERKYDIFTHNYCLNNKIIPMYVEQRINRSYRCNIHQTVESGQVNGALLTVEDVTVEEQEKQELFDKEKNKALNRIIASIAHEIKNPLMSIRTFATLISTKGDNKKFQESFAEFVPSEVDRINKLIESLINYAKPAMREMTPVDVKSIINECMYLTHTVIKNGKILLDTNVLDGMMIEANKNQIKQIIINILMNSIEAMERKIKEFDKKMDGKLTLRICGWLEENHVIITVRDEGIGMTPKELKRCTDPFYTTRATGTGLGLSLLKVYVEENNGILTIDSKQHEYTQITMKFKQYKVS